MEMDPRSALREGEMPDASPTSTPNPNSDIELVEDLMRTVDPRSVVREGEVNQALATGGAADYLLPLLESLKNGTKLSDENRESILFQIQSLDPRSTVREGEYVSKKTMPMMGEEDKNLFMSLMNKGIPEDMIIDIMADSKVPVMGGAVGGAANAGMINPSEFGGLPKTGSSPASGNPSIPTVGGSGATGAGAMTNQDMAMYLQNKVAEIKGRTGGSAGMGALSGVPAGNQTPMAMPKPRPAVMPQRLGADRTFNPTDQLTPTTTLNT